MTGGIHKNIREIARQSWWDRKKAISEITKYPEDEYISFLEDSLRNHDDADIRNAAIEIYTALGEKAFPSLFSMLKDNDPEVRLFTANILGEIGGNKALPSLFASIKDPDENVRVASAEAMGKIGDGQSLEVLKKALNDEHWVAMAALQSIGDIGGDEALSILCDCLSNEELRGFAITAIGKAGDRQSLKYLAPFIESENHVFHRELALEAIINIAERESIRPAPGDLRNVVPALTGILDSPNHEMKKPAFIALCRSEDVRGIPYFLAAMGDDELQEYAIDGILSIGRRAAPPIIRALQASEGDHRRILAKVLSMLGENEALIKFRNDENPEVRTEVALALGMINSATSVRALLKMLSDPFEEVRQAARKSLDSLDVQRSMK
ncbi:MAG: HEAT repeat domain-containing protein [Nitrospirota bacterium]